jgi:Domain of unknown function (DUF4160)
MSPRARLAHPTRAGISRGAAPWLALDHGKIRRGGYIFVTWRGDHPPRHVHVYRDGRLLVKWDLDNKKPMKGKVSRRVLDLIEKLASEDWL